MRDRIELLLAGRKINPWGLGIGLSSGTIDRIKKGKNVSMDTLMPIQYQENVSLSWLMFNKGPPFLVDHIGSDEIAAQTMDCLADESDQWTIHVVRSDLVDDLCLIWTRPDTYEVNDKDYSFTRLEIITGVLGRQSINAIRDKVWTDQVFQHVVDPQTIRAIVQGQLGTWKLFTCDSAIFSAGQSPESIGIAEGNVDYLTITNPDDDHLSDQEIRLLQSFRQLTDGKEQQLLDFAEFLIKPSNK